MFARSSAEALTGVLRHELGHILGFRHEHIRPEAAAPECSENPNWRALTTYDSASVMHYIYCNGTGSGSLALTPRDLEGLYLEYGTLPTADVDPALYLELHPDLQAAFGATNWTAAESHWKPTGRREGRLSSLHFDVRFYLATHGDLRTAFGATNWPAAARHWLNAGLKEGRVSSVGFERQILPFPLSRPGCGLRGKKLSTCITTLDPIRHL